MMGKLQRNSLAGLVFFALAIGVAQRARTQAPFKPTIAAKKHENYVEKLPGSKTTFEMIAIPGGTYLMGSPAAEKGRSPDEGPQHPVTLKPIWMGKCEVTWDEFDLYWQEARMKREKSPPKNVKDDAITGPTPAYVDETYGHGREGFPVLCMSHHCAMDYCRWLSEKTGKEYRLPTEAEWEWACRAGTTTPWFFGDDPAKLGDYAWFVKNSEDFTHKIGTKKPNPWGLHDMYGNVYEWCFDHYEKDVYGKFPADKPALQPVLLPTAKRFSHVARGGSWADEAERCRSATRVGSDKEWIKHDPQRPQSIWWLTKWDVVGFRVVRAVEEQADLKGFRSKITKESD